MARPHPRCECRGRAQGGAKPVAQGSGDGLFGSRRWEVTLFGRMPRRQSARACLRTYARTLAGRCSRTTVAFVLAFSAGIFSSVLPANAANIQNIDLGKAAQVWFAEDHTVPVIAFNISLPAG